MPRPSFSDVSKQFGFQEGRIIIEESYSTDYQYPMAAGSREQSDPFTAMVWKARRTDKDGNALEGEDNEVEIVIRMGDGKTIRPGQIDPKDFDNLDIEAKEVRGEKPEVGSQGNSFCVDQGSKFNMGWGIMEGSLKEKGFKSEILGRCITTDFVGMDAAFKTVEGKPYIAKKDGKNHKKGDTVTPTNLVCEKINVYPYDAKKPSKKASTQASAPASAPKPNGAVNGAVNSTEVVKNLFANLTPDGKKKLESGASLSKDDFQRAVAAELMKQRLTKPDVNKVIIDIIKGGGDGLEGLGNESGCFMAADDQVMIA